MLGQEGVASALVSPRNVRCFAEAMVPMEKTDPIDAEMIARFAIAKAVKPMEPPSSAQKRLKALVARLRQVTGDLTVQKQRRSAAADDLMIDDDPLWSKLAETFRSIKGVAARTVMADLPEIGVFGNKAVSKLVGLAPLADDGGSRKRQRHIRGGRAAEIARRYDDGFFLALANGGAVAGAVFAGAPASADSPLVRDGAFGFAAAGSVVAVAYRSTVRAGPFPAAPAR